jgi:iron-sulfur cluster assembly protein
MAITLTENAAKQIQSQLAKRGKGLALRIGVKKVGCSGLAHTFDIADEIRAGDHTFESHNARVVLNADSLSVLDGSRIDFVTEGLKQMFKFDNPNVESECGCGESFSLGENPDREMLIKAASSTRLNWRRPEFHNAA